MHPIQKFRVWDRQKKTMSMAMDIPMLSGYLAGIYPNLGNEVYLQFTGATDTRGREIY